jgi:hypothetical protein
MLTRVTQNLRDVSFSLIFTVYPFSLEEGHAPLAGCELLLKAGAFCLLLVAFFVQSVNRRLKQHDGAVHPNGHPDDRYQGRGDGEKTADCFKAHNFSFFGYLAFDRIYYITDRVPAPDSFLSVVKNSELGNKKLLDKPQSATSTKKIPI